MDDFGLILLSLLLPALALGQGFDPLAHATSYQIVNGQVFFATTTTTTPAPTLLQRILPFLAEHNLILNSENSDEVDQAIIDSVSGPSLPNEGGQSYGGSVQGGGVLNLPSFSNQNQNQNQGYSSYQNQNSYQSQGSGAYQNPGGYQNPQAYQNPAGYQNQGAYQNPASYQNPSAYQNPGAYGGYQNPQTYQNLQAYQNPQAYQNQNSYQSPPGNYYQPQSQNPNPYNNNYPGQAPMPMPSPYLANEPDNYLSSSSVNVPKQVKAQALFPVQEQNPQRQPLPLSNNGNANANSAKKPASSPLANNINNNYNNGQQSDSAPLKNGNIYYQPSSGLPTATPRPYILPPQSYVDEPQYNFNSNGPQQYAQARKYNVEDTNYEYEDSPLGDMNDDDLQANSAEATTPKPEKEKDFPCPKTGIWQYNGEVCIAVGPAPAWGCKPNDIAQSGRLVFCRNKMAFPFGVNQYEK